jgi:hypothetical protein
LAILAICIAIAAVLKLLLEDYEFVSSTDKSLLGAREEQSNSGLHEYSAADQAPEAGYSHSSSQFENPNVFEPQNESAKPRLSLQRFNAELAAGLIDPPKIDLAEPLVAALTSGRQPVISLSDQVPSMQNRASGVKPGAPVVAVAVGIPPASSAPSSTKPSDVIPALARAADKTVTASSRQSDEREPEGRMTIPAHLGENHQKKPISRNKPFSVRSLTGARVNASGSASTQKSVSRNDASSNGVEPESTIGQRSGDHYAQSRDLSEDLQRFASDFVRTNETDKLAQQHRFFADSVHFYREGDLSLASVEVATRRQHRDHQIKPEIAGPAVATGPVNGGFFVIEQPVRWTQSQGSKVTQGRSVLQLRVVPVSHGEWKITSIDEVK